MASTEPAAAATSSSKETVENSPPTKKIKGPDGDPTPANSSSASEASSASSTAAADAYKDYKISSHDPLRELSRSECPQCKKKYKYFCYECCIPFGDPQRLPLQMKLPILLDVVHHPTESRSKSTAIHAKVLVPNQVTFHEYPDLPDYDIEDTVLLFPSKDAKLIRELDIEELKKIKRVVCIDSQWHKTNTMYSNPKLHKLKCVKIDTHKTNFWRYQRLGDECLATIEAIYYFYAEFEEKLKGKYEGEYDNLLYYYSFFYNLIQDSYKKNPDKVFTKKDNYIKY